MQRRNYCNYQKWEICRNKILFLSHIHILSFQVLCCLFPVCFPIASFLWSLLLLILLVLYSVLRFIALFPPCGLIYICQFLEILQPSVHYILFLCNYAYIFTFHVPSIVLTNLKYHDFFVVFGYLLFMSKFHL